MAIEIEEPTAFENFLHYGLLVGAVFQLICIFAVVFLPKSESEKDEVDEPKSVQQSVSSSLHSSAKKPKKEKKKHR